MSEYPTNLDDVFDSRDVIEAIADIESMIGTNDHPDDFVKEREDLAALGSLAKQGEDYCDDWEYGATLIRDSYFVDYAQELADDLGLIDPNLGWPYTCIDWQHAARELQHDYTAVDFDGVTYWVR